MGLLEMGPWKYPPVRPSGRHQRHQSTPLSHSRNVLRAPRDWTHELMRSVRYLEHVHSVGLLSAIAGPDEGCWDRRNHHTLGLKKCGFISATALSRQVRILHIPAVLYVVQYQTSMIVPDFQDDQ